MSLGHALKVALAALWDGPASNRLTLRRPCGDLHATRNGHAGACAASPTPHASGMRQVTPAGGARHKRGRGGLRIIPVMVALGLTGPALAAGGPSLPSGQDVSLIEVIEDTAPGALWLRLRFLAPAIARETGTVSSEAANTDMEVLCKEFAVPYIAEHDLTPDRVVVSLSDRPVPFGQSNAEATQFFDVFRVENDVCIWEAF